MRLVDADELKEHIIHLILIYRGTRLNNAIIEAINSADTIPLPDFKDGYKQAIIDGKTNFSRPQGNNETTFDDYLKEQLKDPEFKKEYQKASMDMIDFDKMAEEIEEVANKYGLTVDFGCGTIGEETEITLKLRKNKGGEECMEEDAKQASIPYTYNAPQHDWKCGYPDNTRGKKD